MHFTALTSVAFAALASAKTISVAAGEHGFRFAPDNFTASVGDVVEVTFWPLSHSIAQGDPKNPCNPISGAFWSGFVPASTGPADQVFRFQVNTTDPIYFYCAQKTGSHCTNGMVGIINPDSDHAVEDYRAASAKAKSTTNPPQVSGGQLVSSNSSSAGGSSAPSSNSSDTSSDNSSSGGSASGGGAPSNSTSKPNAASMLGSIGSVAAAAVGMAAVLVV